VDFLSARARRDGFRPKVYSDIGSGLNDARPRMLKLLKDGLNCQFDRVYCTYPDRLARIGTRPLVEVLRVAGVDVVAVHVPESQTTEQALMADMIALVTSFAGKIHVRQEAE
jgi:putative resolvase